MLAESAVKFSYKILDTPAGMLHYKKHEGGSKVMIAFHGFGQNCEVFDSLTKALEEEYTIYSIDLFYHGTSSRTTLEPLSVDQWQQCFETLCNTEKIKAFELIAFSIGARFALSAMMVRPFFCEGLHLIAPDGIIKNVWFELATFPVLVRRSFKKLLQKPETLKRLLSYAKRSKLASNRLISFANSQLSTEEQRKLVYLSWTMFKPLRHSVESVAANINRYKIQTNLFFGRHDQVIQHNKFASFTNKLDDYRSHLVNSGHHTLLAKTIPLIGN